MRHSIFGVLSNRLSIKTKCESEMETNHMFLVLQKIKIDNIKLAENLMVSCLLFFTVRYDSNWHSPVHKCWHRLAQFARDHFIKCRKNYQNILEIIICFWQWTRLCSYLISVHQSNFRLCANCTFDLNVYFDFIIIIFLSNIPIFKRSWYDSRQKLHINRI